MANYGKLLKKATNQMNKAMDAYAKQFDITGMQMSFIDYLGEHPGALQRDLEAEFNIQRSTATVALQRMEARGLVVRRPAATDARQKTVALTTKAQALNQQVTDYIAKQQAAMNTTFSEEECATFVDMLNYFITLNGGGHRE
ncbi:MarR family winged helix-turn-helix transcriptional regulator [Lacticaseibacillus sp. GG6-2]